jgi:hypothetical protein
MKIEEYVGMGNSIIPPPIAPTLQEAIGEIQQRIARAVEAMSVELREFCHEPEPTFVLVGENGSRLRWWRADYGLLFRMRQVGVDELETLRKIFNPARIDSFLVYPVSSGRVDLGLLVSARVRKSK